jgi:glyoxylase-like metal-dependent hydrolase (beta-lactamase superfamily II)
MKKKALHFDQTLPAVYGAEQRLSPRITRVLAPNPSPFTFRGTGVYLVGDTKSVTVIDPGPNDPAHLDALLVAIGGRTVSHILITHTHRDHSPAAAPLKAATGAKTYGYGPHGRYDDHVEEGGDCDFVPDVTVRDGDIMESGGNRFQCVFTPGHTSNHMCYALDDEKALFTGDHVMGWSTTVVAPPDGDMGAYMRSLEKLIARRDKILYPTHGTLPARLSLAPADARDPDRACRAARP